ncbi:RNA polymerase sigma-70 factor [Pollutibacter soli]|uniref:RNA polymerase sigma factor n=1 Tax=Pollutibacter soli TaxID=3034157 RepID=UPI003013BF7F
MPIAGYEESKVLLQRIAEGDRVAFTTFYTSHLNKLYRYIFLFTKSKEDTEEILQDIFIKIWENREKLREIDLASSYLTQIAKNKIIDKVRSMQTRHRVLSEIRRSRESFANTTGDDCVYREYYLVVQQAIDKLPPKRKLIFRLNTENGLSQDEIANQLKISRSVVQKQLYSASHFVRKYLFEHGEISMSVIFALTFL